ncbi:MAG: hypothetical protein AAGK14_07965 [Verrucomicrobiota bacterium]
MGQPVKLPHDLVTDAREVADLSERSIAGQIAYWANLGRAIEPLLNGDLALALKKQAATRPLSACLEEIDTPAMHARLRQVLDSRPYPHFEAADQPGCVTKIDADGTRTVGKFIKGQFRALVPA